jgi:hypothetical protein
MASESTTLRGEEPAAGPLDFRRVMVPESQLNQAAEPGVKYAPLPRAEFEQLVELLRSHAKDPTTAAAARIRQTKLSARWGDDNVLAGVATLEIERSPNPNGRGGGDPGALLPLNPCGLAASRPRWLPGESPQRFADATWGLDSGGQMAVLVNRSGSLQFDWTLRGTREPGGGWRYNFELPLAPSSSLELDLPSTLQLRTKSGIVVQSSAVDGNRRRWQLALGGHNRFWVLLSSPEEDRGLQRVALRQSHTYNLSSRELELTSQLSLDVPQEPLRQLEITLEPSLRLLAARHGETPVPWSVLEDAATKTSRIVLEFSEPLQGMGNVIHLGATAPVVLDEPWRLPGLTVHGVFWQEARATLLVQKPLALERLNLNQCRQSSYISSLPPPTTGESIGLQYFVSDASAEVWLAHGQQRLEASSGTVVELSEEAIHAQAAVDLSVSEGQVFSLTAAVPHRWNIDAVESDPPGRVKDWSLNTPTPRTRVLDLRLTRPLSPGTSLRLTVSGHRLNVGPGESLAAEELRLLDVTGAGGSEHYLSVACPEAYQLRLTGGDDLDRYDPENLDPAIADRFSRSPAGLLFRLDPRAARVSLTMERQTPRYTATIEVAATATAGPVWEEYAIECQPQNTGLERVLVHFSHVRVEPPEWRLLGEEHDALQARRLDDEEMLARSGRETGELWEVSLRQPRSSSFVIKANRASPFGETTPLSLVWLPGAAAQEGKVEVRCGVETAMEVLNARLKPVPPDEPRAVAAGLVRAMYRYSPTQDTAAAEVPPIRLARSARARVPTAAVVWHASLESRCEPDGTAHHVATWRIENNGQPILLLQMPEGSEVSEVWVDEDRREARLDGGKLQIPFPTDREYPTVSVHFRTQGPSWDNWSSGTAPLPKTQLDVFACEWLLCLPPGYRAHVCSSSWQRGEPAMPMLQRLLGPLASVPGQSRFNPLSAEHWRRLGNLPWLDQQAERAGERFLAYLGAKTQSLTWSQGLSEVQAALELGQHALLIDQHALWKAGLSPRSPLPAANAATTDLSRGRARLHEACLALVVHGDLLLVTTQQAAAAMTGQLAPLNEAHLWRVRPGPLAVSLGQAVVGDSPRFRRTTQWLAEPLSPWRPCSPAGIDTLGWNVYRLTGPAEELVQVQIVRQSTIELFAWGVFLLTALVCFRRFEKPTFLVVLAAAGAATALLVPEVYAPIASGSVLGFLSALLWQAVVPPPELQARGQSSSHRYKLSAGPRTVTTGALLGVLLPAAAWVRADEEAPPEAPPQRTVHKVFIPVDEKDQPVRDHYLVPEALYTQLERRAARAALEPEDWLLVQADYRGALAWDVAQQRLLVSEFRVRFDVDVFEPAQRVRLPLGREGCVLVPPDRMLVDGFDTPAQWEDEGRLLCFDAGEPGPYRVELSLRPSVNAYADLSGFDLSVPPLASARLELQLPRGAPAVELPGAVGATTLAEEGRRLVVELGRTNRLSVRWRDGAPAASARNTLDVDQLLWLKVQQGSVVLDVRWKFKVVEGSVRRLQLMLDPRLQLQTPLEAKNPLVAQSRTLAPNPQVIQIDLARPVTDQFTLDASLRWLGVSGVGNLRLPLVEMQQVRTLRRLLGVSLDPLLDHEAGNVTGASELTPAEFVAQWGGTETLPRLAWRVTSAAAPWTLAVRLRPIQRTVDSVLAVSLAAGRSTWRYDATVNITGTGFRHRLSVPPHLNVESIEVREDGVPRLARWSRDEVGGSITLFLAEPSSGPQQIVLHGWTPLPPRGPWRLEGIHVEDAEQRSAQVRVYRQPSLIVSVRNRSRLLEQGELQRVLENQLFEVDRRYAAMGRLVNLMQADGPTYAATLLLQTNQPRFECRQITTLGREAGQWHARLECQIRVTRGLVDSLRFEIPDSWQPPFVIAPAPNSSIVHTGDGGRQLIVRPVTALSGESTLRIHGNLVQAAGSRLQVPNIALLGAERLERLVIVPGQLDLQPVAWETRGLSRVEAPSDWTSDEDVSAFEAYVAVDEAFSATLQPAARAPGQPRVALADIQMAWQRDGSVQGVATYDLEPSGNLECPLALPSGYRLLQVSMNGLPALVVAEGISRWRLKLVSDELPQCVEVIFTGRLSSAGPPHRLPAPSLGDLTVQQTLWTIRGPLESSLPKSLPAQTVDVLEQNLIRLQTIDRLLSLAPTDQPPSIDLTTWLRPWIARYRQTRAALEREAALAPHDEKASTLRAELRRIDQSHARLLRNAPLALQAGESASPHLDQPPPVWQLAFGGQPPLRAALSGRSVELELPGPLIPRSNTIVRWIAAAGIVVLAGILVQLPNSRWWPLLVSRRYLAMALFGLLWWLWFWPSIVGLLIISGAAAGGLRPQRRSAREPGSAIVRVGN